MKVYFGFSARKIQEHKGIYELIVDTVHDLGHEINYNWLPEALNAAKKNKFKNAQSFSKVMNSIAQADICVFDISVSTMALGLQISHALNSSKYTLVCKKLEKNQLSIEDMFIGGSRSGFLTLKDYDHKDLKKMISNFIEKNITKSKTRINLSLDSFLIDYINKISFLENKSKTEIIKQSIIERMENDPKYNTEI